MEGVWTRWGSAGRVLESSGHVLELRFFGTKLSRKRTHPCHGRLELGTGPALCAPAGVAKPRCAFCALLLAKLALRLGVFAAEGVAADPWGGFGVLPAHRHLGTDVFAKACYLEGPRFAKTVAMLCGDTAGDVYPESSVWEGASVGRTPTGEAFCGGVPFARSV